ncbi:MAG TPA: TadE/TadG family type IV pilus assembly protein [Xanthobacteraceae bacterium]|nr:TadE/TadG family type IV pilus assembly protein [Xanthobacteraceae bacterium]
MRIAMSLFAARIARSAARLRRDCRGVSVVEFAILLPVMMTLLLGSVEATQGIAADRKVELTAHTLADLSTQYTDINDVDMANILAAGSAILAPYPTTGLREVVSEIAINSQGTGTVVWSDTLGGTALTVGTTVSIPSALAVPNTYLLLAQVQYSYNPGYGYVMTGSITLSDQSFMRPRESASVARTAL